MRLMRREYTKMLSVDALSEDGGSEYGEEIAGGRITPSNSDSMSFCDLSVPANKKRLKEVTVKHILENFQKIGRPGDGRRSTMQRNTYADGDDDDSMRSLSYRYSDPEDANWEVGVEKIPSLISMCGGDLKKFESYYLLRRSNYGTT